MQCKEFQEISDAYLSDELLVETNIRFVRHLEDCRKCREDFAARRELRQKVKRAVFASEDFAIDPIFASRLEQGLHESALRDSGWLRPLFSMRILVPVMSAVLITLFAGYAMFSYLSGTGDQSISAFLTEVSLMAAGNHTDCALEKLDKWEAGMPVSDSGKALASAVSPALADHFGGTAEILHAHDCMFNGRKFGHVIVRRDGRLMSVFFDENGPAADPRFASSDAIVLERENGLQVASFQAGSSAVFVVSDLPETENLNAARAISEDLKRKQKS